MIRQIVSGIMLTLLLTSMLTLAFDVQPVKSTQEPPAVEWSKRFAGAMPNPFEGLPYLVVQTEDGGYAIIGTRNWDFWLIRTDTNGNELWNKTYGGAGREELWSFARTNDGGYVLAGDLPDSGYAGFLVKTDASGIMQWNKTYGLNTRSVVQTTDGGYATAGITSGAGNDGVLMKTDDDGTMLWYETYGGASNDQFESIVQTSDGGYALAGATTSFSLSGKTEAYLVKTDSDGIMQWNKNFSRTNGHDYGRTMIQTHDEGYAIGGQTDYFGSGDAWLVRTNAEGTLLWDKTYDRENSDEVGSIVQTTEGGYALAGQTDFWGSGDAWLIKTDSIGTALWSETFGGAGYDRGCSTIQTHDGGYALAGFTDSFSGDGSYEVWLMKLARSEPRTWIVDDDGPADFHTIQEAINYALEADTIFVRNGTYYENVVVNKSISLIGESMETAIIDGGGVGITVSVLADNVTISGFRIENYYDGGTYVYPCIRSYHSYGNNISGNVIVAEDIIGIWLSESSGNNITENTILEGYSTRSIYLTNSNSNVLSGNILTGTDIAIYLVGSSHNLISRNKIGSYMAYGMDLIASDNNSITENTVGGGPCGLSLGNADWNTVSGNNITDSAYGAMLSSSSNNIFYHNTIKNGGNGVYISSSSNNAFYHNNFIDNEDTPQADTNGNPNIWDDGYPSGGNYWSDYSGVDLHSGPYQNEIGSDGIGDLPYIIDANNRDNYPLKKPYPWDLHDIGITSVECPKNAIGWGYNATVNLMIFNYGNYSEIIDARVYANETLIGEISSIELASRNSAVIPFVWNTSILAKGNYKIKVTADTVPEETDTEDNTFIDNWILITKVGDLGGGVTPEYFNFDNTVDGIDLALFIECYKGLAPPEAMYLADLGGGLPPKFFNCDGEVDGLDLALWIECYKGRGPDT